MRLMAPAQTAQALYNAQSAAVSAARTIQKFWRKYGTRKKSSTGKKIARKVSTKRARSRTGTRTQTEDDLIEISQHNDMSLHKLPVAAVPGKHNYGKVSSKVKFRENYQIVQFNDQQEQLPFFLELMWNRRKVIGNVSTNRNSNDQNSFDPFDLNLVTQHSNTALVPSSAGDDDAQRILCIKGCKVTLEAVSLCTAPLMVTVYYLTPRYDTGENPILTWDNLMNRLSYGLAGVEGPTLISDNNAQFGGEKTANWGVNPEKVRGFKKQWIILGKKTFVLQPGDQRNYASYIKWNKTFRRQTFLDTRTDEYLKGLTVIPMVIQKAGLAGIIESGEGEAVEVAHAAGKAGYAIQYEWDIGFKASPSMPVQVTEQNIVHSKNKSFVKIINDTDTPMTENFT